MSLPANFGGVRSGLGRISELGPESPKTSCDLGETCGKFGRFVATSAEVGPSRAECAVLRKCTHFPDIVTIAWSTDVFMRPQTQSVPQITLSDTANVQQAQQRYCLAARRKHYCTFPQTSSCRSRAMRFPLLRGRSARTSSVRGA